MLVEIDDAVLNDDLKNLIVTDEKGNRMDVSKLKTQADIDRIMQAKKHADAELATVKEKYRDVDVNQYKTLVALQLEQNKDILDNPIYKNLESKYNALTQQYNTLNEDLAKRNQALVDNELKDLIRQNKEIQQTAIDDIFYRAKTAGFEKTEKGFLAKDGSNIDTFIDGLKGSAKHLFKQTSSIQFNQNNINKSLKENDPKGIFSNLNKLR